jgi:hypothetical protein
MVDPEHRVDRVDPVDWVCWVDLVYRLGRLDLVYWLGRLDGRRLLGRFGREHRLDPVGVLSLVPAGLAVGGPAPVIAAVTCAGAACRALEARADADRHAADGLRPGRGPGWVRAARPV